MDFRRAFREAQTSLLRSNRKFDKETTLFIEWLVENDFGLKSFFYLVEKAYDYQDPITGNINVEWFLENYSVKYLVAYSEIKKFLRFARKKADSKTYNSIKRELLYYRY